MTAAAVTCHRCGTVVPANRAEFCADGMLCERCAANADVAAKLGVSAIDSGRALVLAERALARTKALKHVFIGAGGLGLGGAFLAFAVFAFSLGGVSVRGLAIGLALIVGGIVEIARGANGLAKLPPAPPSDERIPTATIVRR